MRCYPRRALGLVLVFPLLAACAGTLPSHAPADAQALAADRIGPGAGFGATDLDAVVSEPLAVDAAVRVALARSPRLQMAYARLGIGAADAFHASRLLNPTLSASRLSGDGGSERSLSLGLSLADALLLPRSRELAGRDLDALRIEVAARLVEVARETEHAWYDHVAAVQAARLHEAVAEAAGASAELAGRFRDAGTISRLQLLRERAAAREAEVAALQARVEVLRTRRVLNQAMGLSGELAAQWQPPDRLPMPSHHEPGLDGLLARAERERLDLEAARLQVGILEDGRDFTRRWRWLGGLELDYEWERESSGSRMRGPGLSLELPLFHQGQARTLRADARLARGRAELAERELAARLGVEEAHGRVQALRGIVSAYAEGIVPDRAEAVERELERYNFMLIGAFELLVAKQAEYTAYAGWIDAVRDYWLARTDLAHAVGGPLPYHAHGEPRQTPDLTGVIAPAGGHAHHGHHESDEGHHDHHDHHGGQP